MKKSGIFSSIVCLGAIVFFASSIKDVYADGVVMPTPGKTIYETDQKAILFYDEGIENLFISITFQGDADNFAWIVPTPSRPEVGKSSDRVFTRLDELTRPEYPSAYRNNYAPTMGVMEDAAVQKSVTVLETKKIEYYDIAILEANDKDALYDWLNDHGYSFPQGGKNIIDDYIQKGWFFTAVKIDDQNFSSLGERQLKTGHALPLRLSFETDQLVYPMKISSINGMEDDALEGTVTYLEGAVGQGVKLDTDRMLSTDAIIDDFNVSNGKVSFFLKKRDSTALNNVLKIEKANSNGLDPEGLRVLNTLNNVYNFSLYAKGINQTFSVDLGSDFKENEWQKFEFRWVVNANDQKKFEPAFFVDDTERTLKLVSSYASSSIVDRIAEKASLSIGGEFYSIIHQRNTINSDNYNPGVNTRQIQPESYFVNHNSDILIDEVQVFSNEKQLFNAAFRDELKVQLADGQEDSLRVFTRKIQDAYGWQKPTGMGVLLYIFADKKYEISGFDVQFAGPINKEGIENIAKIDGKTPWIEPKKNDYYLTRLYKYMDVAEMSEDIYPEESKDQSVFNYAGGEKNRIWFVVGLIGASTLSVFAIIWMVIRSNKKTEKREEKKGEEQKGESKEKQK